MELYPLVLGPKGPSFRVDTEGWVVFEAMPVLLLEKNQKSRDGWQDLYKLLELQFVTPVDQHVTAHFFEGLLNQERDFFLLLFYFLQRPIE